MADELGRPLVDGLPNVTLVEGEKPLALPPGEHVIIGKVHIPGAPETKTPVASEPLHINDSLLGQQSKLQGVTVQSPPKAAAPGVPNGYQSGAPSPHQDTIGRPAGVPPRSIFDFKK